MVKPSTAEKMATAIRYIEEKIIIPVRDEQGGVTHFVSIKQEPAPRP